MAGTDYIYIVASDRGIPQRSFLDLAEAQAYVNGLTPGQRSVLRVYRVALADHGKVFPGRLTIPDLTPEA